MKHFYLVQSLCRVALTQPTKALTHQVTRLRDALERDGHAREAVQLTKLLDSAGRPSEMAPTRIVPSESMLLGEDLTWNTPIPIDKESSTPLAEVHFQNAQKRDLPIFSHTLSHAIDSVIEEWTHYDRMNELDASPSSSCLIYGLPGTGKTQLAYWMAQQLGMPVIVARLDGLMSSFLGTTSRNIGNLFRFANRYNSVLLLDEFDAIAKLRDDPQEVGEIKRVVNTLLQNLDVRHEQGITIGVTNHDTLLDPAIWRRFDVQIEVPIPPANVLTRIISKYLIPLTLEEERIKFLVWCVNGGTGADAKMLVRWIKKNYVVDQDSGEPLIDQLRRYALVNSNRVSTTKRDLLLAPDDKIMKVLTEDRSIGFKKNEIAKIFSLSPSSVSKKLARN